MTLDHSSPNDEIADRIIHETKSSTIQITTICKVLIKDRNAEGIPSRLTACGTDRINMIYRIISEKHFTDELEGSLNPELQRTQI